MDSNTQRSNNKTHSEGLDLNKLIELRSQASMRVSQLQSSSNALAGQIEFVDRMIQSHLAGGSIDSHLALVGAGRRLAELLADDRVVANE